MANTDENYVKVCRGCYDPAIENPNTRICKRCLERFCACYASKIDQQFCCYCMAAVSFEDTVIEKTVTHKALKSKKVFTRVMKARHLVFEGADWMFAQARVVTMTQEELEASIEYHREILNGMMNEREVRRIAHNRAMLKKQMSEASFNYSLQNPAVATVETSKGVKAVRATVSPEAKKAAKAKSQIQAIIDALKAKGFTADQIAKQFAGMAGKS